MFRNDLFKSMQAIVVAGLIQFFLTSTTQAQQYPPMLLSVPWLPQVSPGDWANTKNCGQTVSLMVDGYYDRYSPTSSDITNANQWLRTRFGDRRYLDANGYYTHFTTGRNELGAMLSELHGIRYSVLHGGNTSSILYQLNLGRPVIVGCKISRGSLVATGGVPHWSLVIGWDPVRREFIMNEPGSSSGRMRRVSITQFDASWATQGRIYAPCWK